MATCPKVVKCAAAALSVVVLLIAAYYTYHCREMDHIDADQQAQNEAAAVITVKRDRQIEGIEKDISQIKVDVAVIRAHVAPKNLDATVSTGARPSGGG